MDHNEEHGWAPLAKPTPPSATRPEVEVKLAKRDRKGFVAAYIILRGAAAEWVSALPGVKNVHAWVGDPDRASARIVRSPDGPFIAVVNKGIARIRLGSVAQWPNEEKSGIIGTYAIVGNAMELRFSPDLLQDKPPPRVRAPQLNTHVQPA